MNPPEPLRNATARWRTTISLKVLDAVSPLWLELAFQPSPVQLMPFTTQPVDAYDWLKLVFWWAVLIGICFFFSRLNDSKPKIGRLLSTAAWLAVGTWLVFAGISKINQAWRHQGPGVVSDEYTEKMEPESQYKRHHYVAGALLLSFGVFLIGAAIYHRISWKRTQITPHRSPSKIP